MEIKDYQIRGEGPCIIMETEKKQYYVSNNIMLGFYNKTFTSFIKDKSFDNKIALLEQFKIIISTPFKIGI